MVTQDCLLTLSDPYPLTLLYTFAFGFYFYDDPNFICLINASFGQSLLGCVFTLPKPPWKRAFVLAAAPHLKQVLATFITLANKDKFKEMRGQTWQSPGCSCRPSCAAILGGSITSRTQGLSTASQVQHSWRPNIFGNSHYFRNECLCVFIADHMPALSTIKEIRILQPYFSN